ncbi:alkanesulfonate monooxygenase SsuD/methylene tetrahydromethanopterin reductase-like flavin-dependent oxidoreductase (luciferase family) [Streptomyces griseochromogenes]|uniref:Alkanesulfonate monooxygenase SsuD/methylene tetrahydromethanopterin reductase-like flavin-dependent oxidoreductase (Luciferase family) n=1 Tax=Streptomyces griseochromogenes TaxID=68214 RepID=A0ABS4MAK8_9ACTN|nr:LLM class flavin-dependent oxidoreductase [Streptomyces griseochromogenes]MBP2056668.1 alkanesulfonate monooxygenase SsuD/methylene tetrahydromethanopterin reductase-like flavin-dependent oxidoreductase (luciferase family) [Streptomyces griseochromogenes]
MTGFPVVRLSLTRTPWPPRSRSVETAEVGLTAKPDSNVLFGGFQPAALERVARWGDGFLAAAAPSWAGGLFETVRTFWQEYGRDGEPRIVAQVNVALGPHDVIDDARANMHSYYTFTGIADRMVAGLLTTPTEIRDAIASFADLGADEVMLYCYGLDSNHVDRLADLL